MPSGTDSDIRALVDAFVNDLTEAIRAQAIDSVREALGGLGAGAPARGRPARTGPPARRGRPAKPGRPSKKGGRIRRSAEDLDAMGSAIHAHVQANPGDRLEQISSAINVASKELKRPVQLLMAAGKLRTEGQKRGTMYFAGSGRGGATKKRKTKAAKRGKKAGRRKGGKKRARKAARKATAKKTA